MSDLTDAQAHLLDQAISADPGRGGLNDIEHVIILMQENRSFDHYFGTLSGVRGFADPAASQGIFNQRGYRAGQQDCVQPFRLWSDPPERDGECLNDISHTWPTQHKAWNNGALDSFVTAHVEANGPEDGPVTMGYYTREDWPFYHALADAFTICDGHARDHRPDRVGLPHRVPGDLPVQPWRLRVLRCVRPHVHAQIHRDPVRRSGP